MKIFLFFLILTFTTPAFAEVVEVPPVREIPNGIEEMVGAPSQVAPSAPAKPKESRQSRGYISQNQPAPAPPAPAPRPTPPTTSICRTQPAPACPASVTRNPVEIYGNPTRGFVQNRSNFFIRGYWASQNGNGKPDSQPAFELAPGFIWEGNIRPGGYKWLYIEAIAATGAGAAPVGWKTFEIQPQNQPLIWGWYGWAVYVDSGCFPYFTGAGGKLP